MAQPQDSASTPPEAGRRLPWTAGQALGVVVTFLVLVFVIVVILAFGLAGSGLVTGRHQLQALVSVLSAVLSPLTGLALAYWFLRRRSGVGVLVAALRGRAGRSWLGKVGVWALVGIGGGILAQIGSAGIATAESVVVKVQSNNPLELMPQLRHSPAYLWTIVVGAVLLAPVAEEILFRLVLYQGLRSRWGVALGIIGSALVFSLAHLDPTAVPSLAFAGVMFAGAFELSGSLVPAMVAHATFNLLAIIAAGR